MEMLNIILTVFFVIVCIFLILIILVQSNRSAGMGLFGGGSQSALGSSSGDILTKITGVLAGIFMILALVLAIMKNQANTLTDVKKEIEKPAITGTETEKEAGKEQSTPDKNPVETIAPDKIPNPKPK